MRYQPKIGRLNRSVKWVCPRRRRLFCMASLGCDLVELYGGDGDKGVRAVEYVPDTTVTMNEGP